MKEDDAGLEGAEDDIGTFAAACTVPDADFDTGITVFHLHGPFNFGTGCTVSVRGESGAAIE